MTTTEKKTTNIPQDPDSSGVPVPFAPFEEYQLLDDRPDQPMIIRVELELSGQPNFDFLRKSFDKALEAHPLLRANLIRNKSRLHWEIREKAAINWQKVDANPADLVLEPIDLEKQIGVRVRCSANQIVAEAHHACTDGLGFLQYLHDVFSLYDSLENGMGSKDFLLVHRSSGVLLKQQMRVGRVRAFFDFIKRFPQEFCGGIGLIEYFSHRPVSIARPSAQRKLADLAEPKSFPKVNYRIASIGKENFDRIRSVLKAKKKTINDYFLTAVYSGIDRWWTEQTNSREEPYNKSRNGYFRIMIPINLRSHVSFDSSSQWMGDAPTASNIVSMVFLDRRPWKTTFKKLLGSVALEMNAIKFLRLQTTFVNLLRFLRATRLGIKRLLPKRCVSTTVASNLGKLFSNSPLLQRDKNDSAPKIRFGAVTLESVVIYPPPRRLTSANFALFSYGNELGISMIAIEDEIDIHQSESLMKTIVEEMLNRIDEL